MCTPRWDVQEKVLVPAQMPVKDGAAPLLFSSGAADGRTNHAVNPVEVNRHSWHLQKTTVSVHLVIDRVARDPNKLQLSFTARCRSVRGVAVCCSESCVSQPLCYCTSFSRIEFMRSRHNCLGSKQTANDTVLVIGRGYWRTLHTETC